MATGTIDANSKDAASSLLDTTTFTTVSAYIKGTDITQEGNYRVLLEVSPDDGTTWLDTKVVFRVGSVLTWTGVSTRARLRVEVVQGVASTLTYWLIGA